MEKKKTFLINFAFYAVLVLGAFFAMKFALPALAPFVAAFCIAWLLKRPIRILNTKLHLPKKLAAILTVLLFYGILMTLITQLGLYILSLLATLISSMPALYENLMRPFFVSALQNLDTIFQDLDPAVLDALVETGIQLVQSMGQLVSGVSVRAMSLVSGWATSLPGLFIDLVIMVISTFFIAVDYEKLTGFCLRQLSDRAREVFHMVKKYVKGTLFVCIRSYLIIMTITFVELSFALTLIGIKNARLLAFVIAVFDIMPVLGTGGIMIPWALLTLVQGNIPLGLELLLTYVVITVIRNIIEPKIVGAQLGLHPVVTLMCMFLGLALFGGLGLFGFPIGLSLLLYLNNNGVIKILRCADNSDNP